MTRYLKEIFEPDSERLDAREWDNMTRRDHIKILRAYYDSDDLYNKVQTALEEKSGTTAKLLPLRNPTRTVVEFHVNHLFAGPIDKAFEFIFPEQSSVANDATGAARNTRQTTPTATDALNATDREGNITDAIQQIYDWSNLGTQKQPAIRSLARDGELYIKVVEHPDRDQVYWEFIDAADVVDFDLDQRGFLTWIRIDVIKYRRDSKGKQKPYTVTEVWSKDDNSQSVYEHDKEWGTDLDRLGVDPVVTPMLSTDPAVPGFGIDFIPIVRTAFVEVSGKKEGQAAINGAFDKIDEANRMATRLHRMLASNSGVLYALRANMVDGTGRPIPAPKIETNADGEIELGGNKVVRLPGMTDLTPLVPDLNYTSILGVLQDHLHDMEDDLPELAYKRVKEQAGVSGVALRTLLGDAIARGEEAQGNLAAAIVRANQMSLTIAQRAKIEGFDAAMIGTYEAGDFDHKLKMNPIIPISVSEQAAAFQQLVNGGMPVVVAMRIVGFDDDLIDEVSVELASAEQRKATNFAQATLQATAQLQGQRQQQQQAQQGANNQPPAQQGQAAA